MSNNAKQWMSDISKVLSFYYGNKVFIIYLHKSVQLWCFSSLKGLVHETSALVARTQAAT